MSLTVLGCRSPETDVPDSGKHADLEEAPEPGSAAEPGSGGLQCDALGEAAAADEAYAAGVAKLEEAQDGEHYVAAPFEQGMESLLVAAQLGHRSAQSLYGRRRFETMFMADGPAPEQREAYVTALSFIRIAARRGDAQASDYLPGLAQPPDLEQPPLDSFPPDWISEAIARADAWLSCHGETVADRGHTP